MACPSAVSWSRSPASSTGSRATASPFPLPRMRDMSIAAIDQGTTSTRALMLQPDGSARVAKAVEHRQIYPQPGWVEHDPEELIDNLNACAEAIGEAGALGIDNRSEEHTSELQSLMRTPYAVFCLTKKQPQ